MIELHTMLRGDKIILLLGKGTFIVDVYGAPQENFLINIVATLEMYEGKDHWPHGSTESSSGGEIYTGSNAVNLRRDFLSKLTSSKTENFESYPSNYDSWIDVDERLKLKFTTYWLGSRYEIAGISS